MSTFAPPQLPPPPAGRTGWPWDATLATLPPAMPDGTPWPRITLVTPSFRQAEFLEETLRSVLLQGYPNLEYMVIDGGSTDGSVEIIRRYAGWLSHWESEPDRGQSHALAKGFARATGDMMGWINSDDLLTPGALEAVALAAARSPGALVAGPVIRFEHGGRAEQLRPQYGLSFENLVMHWRRRCQFQQPGLFFPRALFERVGGVDEGLHYSMDYDLFCRLLRHTTATYVEQPLARFRYHTTSKTVSQEERFIREGLRVSRRYWGDWLPTSERRLAERNAARRLTRQAMRRLAGGNLRRSAQLYAEAVRYSPLATLTEPLLSALGFVQRRLHAVER